MTPADEIEYIIKEFEVNDNISYYTIKSFPEICLMIYESHYIVDIMKEYRYNDDVDKRFEELIDEFRTRKIIFENQIFDVNRKIVFYGNRNRLTVFVPIYYEDCVFTSSPYDGIDECCENCIAENGG